VPPYPNRFISADILPTKFPTLADIRQKMRDMDSCNGVFLVTKRYKLVDHEICMYNLKSASLRCIHTAKKLGAVIKSTRPRKDKDGGEVDMPRGGMA